MSELQQEDYDEDGDNEYLIEMLQDDVRLFKNTINNLNAFVEALKQSNMILNQQLDDLENILSQRSEIVLKFIESKGYKPEDLYEFETELKAGIKHEKKKKPKD